MKVLEGKLVATKGKFAIVGARFNEFIVSKLISGAEDTGSNEIYHCRFTPPIDSLKA